MKDMVDDMRNLSKQFNNGNATYKETMPKLLKLRKELQDRNDLLSRSLSSS